MRKKFLYVILIVLMILPSIIPIGVYAIENNTPYNSQSDKTDISNDSDNQEDTSNYSQAYLEYLELSDEEKAKLSVIPRKYNVPLDIIYEDTIEVEAEPSLYNLFGLSKDTTLVSTYADELPTSFNLRDEIDIPMKNQRTEGLCWAFASIRSLETNLALHNYGYYDYSELHLGYINMLLIPGRDLDSGGYFSDFQGYVSGNFGPVYEEIVPYDDVYDMNNEEDANYLLSLESKAYNVKTIDFPTIDKMYSDYTEEQLNLFREKVKKHIMENGSIYASICSKGINYVNGYDSLYNSIGATDHAISIIGWDDNFAKENFKDENGNNPNKDGAYIALNSWGESIEIFYISYEDATVERDMSGVVSATTNFNEIITEEIQFEDESLYYILKEELCKNIVSCNDDTLTLRVFNTNQKIMLNLDSQNTGKVINNLSGLEKLTDIYYLNLNNNNLTDINTLWELKNLEAVFLDNNGLEDLGNIQEMPKLKCLSLKNNNLNDINGISKLTNLSELYIDNNNLTNVDELKTLTNLYSLKLSNNMISDINFVKKLPKIEFIEVAYNNIQDVSAIGTIAAYMYELDLSGNPIISGLDKITNAQYLVLDECNLSDSILSQIIGLNLDGLSLRNNNISNVKLLENLNLHSLDLSENLELNLSTIPLRWRNK